MKYSIIIGSYQHLLDCTKPCLESIIRNTTLNPEQIEIIIVGNGCTDGTKEYVQSLGKPFIYLDFPDALGYSRANNEGLKIAKGDYLILLNNDTIILDWPKDAWLNILVSAFEKNPKCGISGPSMGYSGPADANFLIFFCVMISRKCYETVGPLDEIFKEGGGEDTSYCIEAERKGFDLMQVPQDSLWVHKDYMVGAFPIYHPGEKTVHGLKNWDEIFKRNSDFLRTRYNMKHKLSISGERLVIGKNDPVDSWGITRYEWAKKNIYGSKILEIGCASGYGTKLLKDIPNFNYLGIDYNPDIIEYAKKNFGDIIGTKFQQADINNFEFGQYDTIIAFETLEHLDSGKEMAQKLKKHCKRLLITVPYNEDPGRFSKCHKINNLKEIDFPDFEYYYILTDASLQNKYTDLGGVSLLTMKWTDPTVKQVGPKIKNTITCVISTKNRSHTTLPMTIMAVCNQSVKPNHLIIYDDGDFKPGLDKDPIYSKLFATISACGISWEYKYGHKAGQVANHIQSIKDSPTELIWRLDDDNIPEYNVLESLLNCITDNVGAVGGLIINEYVPVPHV